MSAQPFTPEQLTTIQKLVRQGVREELDRIITAGFNCTAEADAQTSGAKPPGFKPASETQPQPTEELPFNPELCNWQPDTGPRGDYESCKDGANFGYLKKYLETHNGKATLEGRFYWLFTDGNRVGRKEKGGS